MWTTTGSNCEEEYAAEEFEVEDRELEEGVIAAGHGVEGEEEFCTKLGGAVPGWLEGDGGRGRVGPHVRAEVAEPVRGGGAEEEGDLGAIEDQALEAVVLVAGVEVVAREIVFVTPPGPLA